MKINLIAILFFLIFPFNFLEAQVTLSGTLVDKNGNGVSFANIFVKPQASQSVVAFTHTDNDGKYFLEFSNTGHLEITFTAMSYKTVSLIIFVEENKKYTQNVVLADEAMTLDEVIIEKEKPVTIKKDTIIFDAKAFAKGNETVVEDLLRRIRD